MPLKLPRNSPLLPAAGQPKAPVRKRKKPPPDGADLPVASAVTYRLPLPPTANNLFPTVVIGGRARRVKSKEYRKWLAAAAKAAKEQGLARVPSPVAISVTIEGGPKFRRSRDLDNGFKGVVDFLKQAGAIENDNLCHVVRLVADFVRVAGESGCVVTIASVEAEPGVTMADDDHRR